MSLQEGAELLEGRMNFIQKFLQKKYAWGIVFFVLIGLGIGAYFRGVDDGKKNAKEEISSLVNTSNYKSIQITALVADVENYKTLYENCSKSLSSRDVNEILKKELEKYEALEAIINKSVQDKKETIKTLKPVL